MKAPLALAALTSLASPAFAKNDTLPKEVQSLHKLVGLWTAKQATFTMAGKAQKVDITIDCKATSGGWGVACQSKIVAPGMVIEETDLFGYDAQHKRYHWYAVTSQGETHDHAGMPTSGDRSFVFVHAGPMDGKPMQEILRMTFDATEKKIDFRSDGIVDGQPVWQISGALTKK